MVLVRSDLDFKLKSIEVDNEGRYVIIEADVQSSNFLFVNTYAPNKVQEQCRFFDNLNKAIENFVVDKENKIIIGGDFDVTLDSNLDCAGGNPSNKVPIKNIQDIRLDFDLVDIWRIRNPDIKRFTWRQKKLFIQRRLDYWLISDVCQDDIEKSDIISSINSDHSAIFLHFNNIVDQKHGPSFWKSNASLAEDGNFATLINESIPTWLEEFKTIDDKSLLWDLIKYKIRQLSIKYGKERASKKRKRITDIEALPKICEENCRCPSAENLEQFEILKLEYDSINEWLRELNISPLDAFRLTCVIEANPTEWQKGLKTCQYITAEPFNLQDQIQLHLNGQNVRISKAVSTIIYKELRDRIITPPTVQFKYNDLFENDVLDWKQIYSLPHRVALDTKLHEFQYKLLNRCLATNAFLCKISILSSSACSLCGEAGKSLEHLLVTCHYSVNFGGEVIKWINSLDIQIVSLCCKI